MSLKSKISLFSLAVLSFTPFVWRLLYKGISEPIGLLSDFGVGLFLFIVLLYSPHWLRVILGVIWAVFSVAANELVLAMQRLPGWEDLHYLTNPSFVKNSAGSFNLFSPGLALVLILSALLVSILPVSRPQGRFFLPVGLVISISLLSLQSYLSISYDEQSVAARHNALHWFIADAVLTAPRLTAQELDKYPLPKGINTLDMQGQSLLTRSPAKNVLIIAMEGIPGLYYPEIRKAIGINQNQVSMDRLAKSTSHAMLIPDFVNHSHQTIRGLYAMLCGDYSKLSWSTPKAVELQTRPERAKDCLPAQLSRQGWSTHYLQAAGLSFMGKDRIMPLIGFQQVHGHKWFKEANPFPFQWGVIDSVFFRGARSYIDELRQKNKPWMLTLLTVGTHQPYAVPDEIAKKYPSRSAATVDLLDQAVAGFIDSLRKDGVLNDTLVIISSDESHGSSKADWISSWGLGVILAPGIQSLPRIKRGSYGLLDVEASVLDYLGQPIPDTIIGRSFFRDYSEARDMVSFTASKHRWHTASNLRYECSNDGRCRVGKASSLLGYAPDEFIHDADGSGSQIFPISEVLDRKIISKSGVRVLKFANGEIRKLPEKIISEWSDSLIGAQYLDFPAHSRVDVSIKVKMLEAPPEGVQLRLVLKQWEHTLNDIQYKAFPVLYEQQQGSLKFSFDNSLPRQAFSFHLLGEGKDAVLQLQQFDVSIDDGQNSS